LPVRGVGKGLGCGDTVETFLERVAILDLAAEILGLPAASVPHNTRSETFLPIRFGGMKFGKLVALAGAAHVGAAGWAVNSTIRCLTAQDARVRVVTHDDVIMESTIYERLATAMITAMSRRRSAPGEDGSDNEPM
jgi:hypothetical protein